MSSVGGYHHAHLHHVKRRPAHVVAQHLQICQLANLWHAGEGGGCKEVSRLRVVAVRRWFNDASRLT